MHLNSEMLFTKYAWEYFQSGITVLEIGPNRRNSSYWSIVQDHTIKWDTLSLERTSIRGLTYYVKSEYEYPISDDSYDIVLSGQVLEHVRKPWIWMKELGRICKKGGHVITISPVSWGYHEAPVDCWRVYPEGMKALYDEAQLEVILSVCECLEDVDHSSDTITIGKK